MTHRIQCPHCGHPLPATVSISVQTDSWAAEMQRRILNFQGCRRCAARSLPPAATTGAGLYQPHNRKALAMTDTELLELLNRPGAVKLTPALREQLENLSRLCDRRYEQTGDGKWLANGRLARRALRLRDVKPLNYRLGRKSENSALDTKRL